MDKLARELTVVQRGDNAPFPFWEKEHEGIDRVAQKKSGKREKGIRQNFQRCADIVDEQNGASADNKGCR